MIDFRKATYVKSATKPEEGPKDSLPWILFCGRSNVGKSTLINGLTGQKIAFSSKKAGKTKLLNYFLVDDSFYLVDSPGYGSTAYANFTTINFAKMMEGSLREKRVKAVVLLVDLRREAGKDDVSFFRYLEDSGVPLVTVITKCDLMNQSARSQAKRWAGEYGLSEPIFAAADSSSYLEVRRRIATLL